MATIPRVLLLRTNESASPVCPFMALSGRATRADKCLLSGGITDMTRTLRDVCS
jgi:hypothetical protein